MEPFFGAGGMFWSLPQRARYCYLNDSDDDIFNLWQIANDPEKFAKLYAYLERVPYHQSVFRYFKTLKRTKLGEGCAIVKAARFLVLSNWSYMGKADTLRLEESSNKAETLSQYTEFQDAILKLENVSFGSDDFRKFLVKFSAEPSDVFAYCDPPYLGTDSNYHHKGWNETDTRDLFALLMKTGYKFAVSEFQHPVVLELAAHYKLHVTVIGERQSMKKRDVEILVHNYPITSKLF
jgi:DNA adenine methylase